MCRRSQCCSGKKWNLHFLRMLHVGWRRCTGKFPRECWREFHTHAGRTRLSRPEKSLWRERTLFGGRFKSLLWLINEIKVLQIMWKHRLVIDVIDTVGKECEWHVLRKWRWRRDAPLVCFLLMRHSFWHCLNKHVMHKFWNAMNCINSPNHPIIKHVRQKRSETGVGAAQPKCTRLIWLIFDFPLFVPAILNCTHTTWF